MRVIVQLRDDPPAAADRQGTRASGRLASVLDDYALTARPLDPGTTDPTLRRFYTIDLPPEVSVDDLLDRLRTLDGVEAAYVKPPDEMP